MGNASSGPSPPTVNEEAPPGGSGESSMIYPARDGTPRLDGISRTLTDECKECVLRISSGISSSSVKLTREFGTVSILQCRRYADDKKRVTDKQMSIQDFIGNLQSGRYLRDLNNGFCEQVQLPEDEAEKVTKIEEFKEDKLQSIRIQRMSSGGFSSDTKAKLSPSIPFEMTFNGERIPIRTMTVFHPCPLRLEGFQPDAVMCLNDPSFDDPKYVIIIPLVARNSAHPSVAFFDKVLSQVTTVAAPEPSGSYPIRNIPTGEKWSLSRLFDIKPVEGTSMEVTNGYYVWKGIPPLERIRTDGPGNTINYSWRESAKSAPQYIMVDAPVAISTTALAGITQALPVTPALDAVHAVLYSTDPNNRGIFHKAGPPGSSCSAKETFVDLKGAYADAEKTYAQAESGANFLFGEGTQEEEEACDPWTFWAQASAGKGFTEQQVIDFIFKALVFVAMGVGAYLALNAVLRFYDVKYSELASGIGKITAVFARNLQQKTNAIREKLSVGIPSIPLAVPTAPPALAVPAAPPALAEAFPLPPPRRRRIIAPEPED